MPRFADTTMCHYLSCEGVKLVMETVEVKHVDVQISEFMLAFEYSMTNVSVYCRQEQSFDRLSSESPAPMPPLQRQCLDS